MFCIHFRIRDIHRKGERVIAHCESHQDDGCEAQTRVPAYLSFMMLVYPLNILKVFFDFGPGNLIFLV